MLRSNNRTLGILCLFLVTLFICGCNRSTAREGTPKLSAPLVRVSAEGVDAAEPATAVAPNGSFYVAWVNHDANNRADVMIGRYEPRKHQLPPCALIRLELHRFGRNFFKTGDRER